MSRTLTWQPVTSAHVPNAMRNEIDVLRKVFGSYPITLTDDDGIRLMTLSATYDGKDPNPYDYLLTQLVEHGRIILDVEA